MAFSKTGKKQGWAPVWTDDASRIEGRYMQSNTTSDIGYTTGIHTREPMGPLRLDVTVNGMILLRKHNKLCGLDVGQTESGKCQAGHLCRGESVC